jgi:tetratricopeptide (TPR) repeat protein
LAELVQIFVRNDQGTVWGPLAPATIELLIDNGLLTGKLQVALDGVNYTFPGRVPKVRQYFPRELWGEAIAPGDDLNQPPPPPPPVPQEMQGGDAAVAAAAGAPVLSPDAPAPMAGPGAAPMAGPGVRAGPGAAPRAGPGAVRQPGRPMTPMQRPAAARPPPVMVPKAAPSAPVLEAEVLEAEVIPAAPASAPVLEAEVIDAEVLPAEVDPSEAPTPPPAPVILAPPPPPARASAPVILTPEPPPPARASAPVILTPEPPPPAHAPGPPKPIDLRTQPGAPPTLRPAPPPIEAPSDLPKSGLLDEHLGPIRLYYIAAAGEATGLLTLKTTGHTLQLHFRKGSPEYFNSDHADDEVGAFLVRQGLLNKGQLDQAEAKKAQFGGELVAALFGLGIINPGSAFTQLAQRAQAILHKAMLVETGTFTFEAIELPAHRAMPLGNKWGILSEQLRKVPIAEVKRRLGEAMDMPVMKAGGRVDAGELKLTPQEARAFSHFDGVRSLHQLERDLPQDADNHCRVAWYLQQLEAVSFAAVKLPAPGSRPPPPAAAPQPKLEEVAAKTQPGAGGAARPGAPAAAKPAAPKAAAAPKPAAPAPAAKPAAPAAPRAAPSDPVAELKELEKVAAAIRKQNHFELFGLKKEPADPAAVKQAYLKLARTWHPDTVPPHAPEGLAKLKEEIFGRIGDAQRVLSDKNATEDYLAELELGSGDKMEIARIFNAEEFFHKGEILVKARKFPDAVKSLEEAIANNPDEGEYYAWRGYAKFFSAADKKTNHAEALRDINLCIAKNPRCAPAYYFLGHIAKVMGDLKEAKKQFKKCLELNEKHIDAERELRMLK